MLLRSIMLRKTGGRQFQVTAAPIRTNPKQDVNNVSVVARRFLSAPSTSVASERMFSGAGNIYSDSRSRLSPERAEMLLFIKYNFRLCHASVDNNNIY